MRYPASEKLEIIRLVERSHLPVRRALDKLGIPATTFYSWYDRYRAFGELKTVPVVPAGSGTASPTMSAAGSWTWPSMSRSCRRGNWR